MITKFVTHYLISTGSTLKNSDLALEIRLDGCVGAADDYVVVYEDIEIETMLAEMSVR